MISSQVKTEEVDAEICYLVSLAEAHVVPCFGHPVTYYARVVTLMGCGLYQRAIRVNRIGGIGMSPKSAITIFVYCYAPYVRSDYIVAEGHVDDLIALLAHI